MNYNLELESLHDKSVGRLLAAEVYDRCAFDELAMCLTRCVQEENKKSHVSRQVLQILTGAIGSFESRAEYLPELANEDAMISKFQTLLRCFIIGEDPDNRQPGVPRII